jgi:replicative DNA helicase
MAWLSDIELATKLANIAERHNDGDVDDLYSEVSRVTDGYRQRLGLRAIQYIDIPIGELLQDEFDDSGIRWRLDCLNVSMRRLRPGDFGIIAGRPDKGKTTFLTSEVTYFAPQLPADRNIIWLNNEGPGKRIIPRLYQSALNYSMTDMKEKHAAGVLVDQYRSAVSRLDKIRIIDVHGFNTGNIEAILEESNPGVIIYDMIDNIKGFGGEARTDLALEEMYKWARERSVKYDCIGLATSQISNDGDGMQFPTLGMLKDSKTGKQGACDFQLMIGASNDQNLSGMRYLSLPKNKLRRPDGASDPRAEVIFDGTRARYRDIPIGS